VRRRPSRWPQWFLAPASEPDTDQDLPTFLREPGLELSDVVRNGHSWSELRCEAGLPTRSGSALEAGRLKRVRAFTHVDDADTYRGLLADDAPAYSI